MKLNKDELEFLRAVNGRGLCDPKYLPKTSFESKKARQALRQLGLVKFVRENFPRNRWRITTIGERELDNHNETAPAFDEFKT